MRSPRDRIGRVRKPRTEPWRTLTLERFGRGPTASQRLKKKVASKIGKSALCAICQGNRGLRDILLGPILKTT